MKWKAYISGFFLLIMMVPVMIKAQVTQSSLLQQTLLEISPKSLGAPDTSVLGAPFEPSKGYFHIKQYSVQNGVFSNDIGGLVIDGYNRVWFISWDAGLGCIDGHHVLRYSVRQGLGDRFRSLGLDGKGRLWIGSNGYGLYCVDGDRFWHYHTDHIPDVHINKITANADGSVWVATAFGGIFRVNEDTLWTIDDSTRFEQVYNRKSRPAMLEDSRNRVWSLGKEGLQVIDHEDVYQNPEISGVKAGKKIFEDSRGDIWACTDKAELWHFPKGNPEEPIKIDNPLGEHINRIDEDSKGQIWLASSYEMAVGNREGFAKYPSSIFTGDRQSISGFQVHQDQIWACVGNTISFVHDLQFTVPSQLVGVQNGLTYQAANGNVWVHSRQDKSHADQYEFNSKLEAVTECHDPNVHALGFAPDGKRWAVYKNNDIGYYDGCTFIKVSNVLAKHGSGHWFHFNHEDGWLVTDNCLYKLVNGKFIPRYEGKFHAIEKGPNGRYYSLQNKLLYRLEDDDSWTDLTLPETGMVHCTRLISPIGQDRLFVGTWGDFVYEITADGVVRPPGEQSTHIIRQAYEGPNGWIWFCGQGTGLTLYNGKEMVGIGDLGGVIPNDCWYVGHDNRNRIWIGTNEGYYRLTPKGKDLQIDTATDILAKYELRHFNQQKSILSLKGGSHGLHAPIFLKEGANVWLPSRRGGIVYCGDAVIDKTPPSVFFTGISIGHEVLSWDSIQVDGIAWEGLDATFKLPKELVLDHMYNDVTMEFGGLDWYLMEEVKFSFYLEGLEETWRTPIRVFNADYSNLPAGIYTFHLKAVNAEGLESEEIHYSFSVSAPFWEKWWFYLVCLLGLGLAIRGLIRARTRALKARQVELESIVEERTHELRHEKHIVEQKNKEIIDSINYAKRLQEAIIPSEDEFKAVFDDSFVFYKPKDIVAGDFYWMHSLGDLTYLAVADCTGHGVPGAIVSVVCSNALNRVVEEFGKLEPGEVLDKARKLIEDAFETNDRGVKDGMDICLITINHATGVMSYAGAHNPLWVFNATDGSLSEIKADKQPVGYVDQVKPFTTHDVPTREGDVIYMFSDGYADQFGGIKGKKFKSTNMKQLLQEIHKMEMAEQLEIIDERFEAWRGELEQVDDVCLIGIRIGAKD